jgi:hypothetical protein
MVLEQTELGDGWCWHCQYLEGANLWPTPVDDTVTLDLSHTQVLVMFMSLRGITQTIKRHAFRGHSYIGGAKLDLGGAEG